MYLTFDRFISYTKIGCSLTHVDIGLLAIHILCHGLLLQHNEKRSDCRDQQ